MRPSKRAGDRTVMKCGKFVFHFFLLISFLPYIYGGCVVVFKSGDIDSNEVKHNEDTEVVFVGITTQAQISSTNAEDLISGAFAAGLTDVATISSPLNRSTINSQIDTFRPLRVPIILGDSLRRIELDPTNHAFNRTDVIAKEGEFEGACGGGFSYTLEFNRISARFYGYISFQDYCDDGILVSGDTDIEGDFDVVSGDFMIADFLFDDLSDGHLTLDGEASIDFIDSPILLTFTAYSTDEYIGKTYWFKEYSIALVEWIGYSEIEIFGTFYHPDYGFVLLTTTNPLLIHGADGWPTSGQFTISGNNATKAQLTAIDQSHLGIEADTDGDGMFDWDSGLLIWSDL